MKAVIMAGGEGTRLRPLTCDIPKPMLSVCGKPVLARIVDLLAENGFDEAVITTKYLSNVIEDYFLRNPEKRMKITISKEKEPLGTAGSVRLAAKGFGDDFLVISGDAVCDFDLKKAVSFHKKKSADATLVLSEVADPREYGLVSVDSDGKISGFIEKPSWTQSFSSLANTGVYILSPSVFDIIPENGSSDFGRDIFPSMLKDGKRLYAVKSSGYWCDIGSISGFLTATNDMLSGKVNVKVGNLSRDGVYAPESIFKDGLKIFPPCFIGERVKIGSNVVIGPNAVIEDGCKICDNARIKNSVIQNSAYIGREAKISGAVVAPSASVKSEAQMFEESVLGSSSVLGEGSTVLSGVSVWPGKNIPDGSYLTKDVCEEVIRPELFDEDGVTGETGVEITPEFCARLGAALGSVKGVSRIGAASSSENSAVVLCSALKSGILSCGAKVWDFHEIPENILAFASCKCDTDLQVYVTGGRKCSIKISNMGGMPLDRISEREIESNFRKNRRDRISFSEISKPVDMSSVRDMYLRELCKCAPRGLIGVGAQINCADADSRTVFRNAVSELGGALDGDIRFQLSPDGKRLSVTDENGRHIPEEKLLAVLCIDEFTEEHDMILPFDAPKIIDEIAKKHHKSVERYTVCPYDKSEDKIKRKISDCLFINDGIMQGIKLLNIMSKNSTTLAEEIDALPEFSSFSRSFKISLPPSVIMNSLSKDFTVCREGMETKTDRGYVNVRPDKRGSRLKIIAEADTAEIAEAVCDEISRKINAVALDIKGKQR